jgi:hypothetical protein
LKKNSAHKMWSISQAFLFDKGFIKCLEKKNYSKGEKKRRIIHNTDMLFNRKMRIKQNINAAV